MEVAVCMNSCDWVPQSHTGTGEILVAWLDANQQPGKAAVAGPIMAQGGTAVLDAKGNIHVAVYDDYPLAQFGSTVRYLQIGP
jgi:hypothetical protein